MDVAAPLAEILKVTPEAAGKNLTRESLVTALESMRDYNMGGFTVNYSPQSHEGSRFTDLTIIGRGGKFMR